MVSSIPSTTAEQRCVSHRRHKHQNHGIRDGFEPVDPPPIRDSANRLRLSPGTRLVPHKKWVTHSQTFVRTHACQAIHSLFQGSLRIWLASFSAHSCTALLSTTCNLPVEAESKTLVPRRKGAPWAKPAQNLLAHQTTPRRGGAQLEVCTSAAADAAEAQPTHFLGLGSLTGVLRPMASPWRRRQFNWRSGGSAAVGCTGAVVIMVQCFLR